MSILRTVLTEKRPFLVKLKDSNPNSILCVRNCVSTDELHRGVEVAITKGNRFVKKTLENFNAKILNPLDYYIVIAEKDILDLNRNNGQLLPKSVCEKILFDNKIE